MDNWDDHGNLRFSMKDTFVFLGYQCETENQSLNVGHGHLKIAFDIISYKKVLHVVVCSKYYFKGGKWGLVKICNPLTSKVNLVSLIRGSLLLGDSFTWVLVFISFFGKFGTAVSFSFINAAAGRKQTNVTSFEFVFPDSSKSISTTATYILPSSLQPVQELVCGELDKGVV